MMFHGNEVSNIIDGGELVITRDNRIGYIDNYNAGMDSLSVFFITNDDIDGIEEKFSVDSVLKLSLFFKRVGVVRFPNNDSMLKLHKEEMKIIWGDRVTCDSTKYELDLTKVNDLNDCKNVLKAISDTLLNNLEDTYITKTEDTAMYLKEITDN